MISELINFILLRRQKFNVYENFPKDFQLKRVFIVNGKKMEKLEVVTL